MASANRTWGEERIAAELLVKLGIRVSPLTVRRYMPTGSASRRNAVAAMERFLRGDLGDVPSVLRLRRVGGGHPTDSAWNVTEQTAPASMRAVIEAPGVARDRAYLTGRSISGGIRAPGQRADGTAYWK
jgi:hypothetical protein